MSLIEEVQRILWEDWDPLGVKALGGPDDEYHTYAWDISRYLLEGRDEQKLFDHLQELQREAMGLSELDTERDQQVAKKLSALRPRFRN